MPKIRTEEYDPTDKPTSKKIRRLLEKQDYCCALTGVPLEPEDANLDHIVPISKGGSHTMGNVQVVHKVVNQMKLDLTQDEFFEWCQKVVGHNAL